MKKRRLTGDVLLFLAAAFTIYLSVVMIQRINSVVLKDSYVSVFKYELGVCVFFVLFALDVRFNLFGRARNKALKVIGWIFRILVVLVCAVLLFFLVKVTIGSFIRTEGQADHVLVLGQALEDGKPTDDLLSRLDTAEQYAEKNPEATLILTGGNPDASGKTEAGVMREILLSRGIPDERMILEDKAKSTRTNFSNTAKLVNPDDPVVLITSNYHMDRASRTAKSAGFTKVLRLPAPSSTLFFGANVLWEVIMEVNELTLRQD